MRATVSYLKALPPLLQPQSQDTTEARSQQASGSPKAHLPLGATAEPSYFLLAHPSWPAARLAPRAATGKAQDCATVSRTREELKGIHVNSAPSRKGGCDRRDQDNPKQDTGSGTTHPAPEDTPCSLQSSPPELYTHEGVIY